MDQAQRTSRTGPLPKVSAAAVKAGAHETALNVAGAVRDAVSEAARADRWTKYKAGILGAWLALSAAGIFVACPSDGPSNELRARLVRTTVVNTPVFMIVNDSGTDWEDVVVEVNHAYRASVARVSAQQPENNITLEPRKLLGEGGAPAPFDLQVSDLVVRANEGTAELMVGGKLID